MSSLHLFISYLSSLNVVFPGKSSFQMERMFSECCCQQRYCQRTFLYELIEICGLNRSQTLTIPLKHMSCNIMRLGSGHIPEFHLLVLSQNIICKTTTECNTESMILAALIAILNSFYQHEYSKYATNLINTNFSPKVRKKLIFYRVASHQRSAKTQLL